MSNDVALAVTTSGCGEHLIKTNLARELSRQLHNSSYPLIAINKCFNDDFIRKYFDFLVCLIHLNAKKKTYRVTLF